MEFTENGRLTVRTYAASGGYPVEGAVVRIRGATEENRIEEFSFITDEDGLTDPVVLSTPSRSYSLSPGQNQIPYAQYNVEIMKEGYFTKNIFNVSVFSGIDSYLPVNMIPLDAAEEYHQRPGGNLNAVVTQNEMLS